MSRESVIGTTLAGILSSFLAFLGVVTCCGMPIVAGVLAWLGIGASQLSFFAEYRPLFMLIAVVSLCFGFWKVYFKRPSACCAPTKSCCSPAEQEPSTNSCCCTPKTEEKPQNNCCDTTASDAKSKSQLFQKIFLWVGAVVIALMIFLGK